MIEWILQLMTQHPLIFTQTPSFIEAKSGCAKSQKILDLWALSALLLQKVTKFGYNNTSHDVGHL